MMKSVKGLLEFGLPLLLLLLLTAVPSNLLAMDNEDARVEKELEDLLDIGFAELANITLTTASRKEQRLFDTSAA